MDDGARNVLRRNGSLCWMRPEDEKIRRHIDVVTVRYRLANRLATTPTLRSSEASRRQRATTSPHESPEHLHLSDAADRQSDDFRVSGHSKRLPCPAERLSIDEECLASEHSGACSRDLLQCRSCAYIVSQTGIPNLGEAIRRSAVSGGSTGSMSAQAAPSAVSRTSCRWPPGLLPRPSAPRPGTR
jgi:hypothetical protein